jgi:hypothetical protein
MHRSARLSSIALKIGIVRVFSKKHTSIFYLGKKASKKNYRATNFSIFHDFYIIPSLKTQRIFIAETCAWVCFIEQNKKIKKTNNNNI